MSQSALAFSGESSPSVFNFGDHAVRIIMRAGEPWFVAADVATALGYLTAKDAARNLGEHQKGGHILPTPGGEQRVTIINESGLYRLVLRSRKPEAEKFSDWVTGKVLPSIRKTGGYQRPEAAPAIDVTDAPAMAAAQKTALDYFDAYRAAVKAGKGWAEMEDNIPGDALLGMIAHAVMSQRMIVSFSPDSGRMHSRLIPGDVSVVSFSKDDYYDIVQHIPMERIPEMLEALSKRTACHLGAFSDYLKRNRSNSKQAAPGVLAQA